MSIKKDILMRVAVVYVFILLCAVMIIGRVIYLQFFEGSKWHAAAEKNTFKNVVVEASRGDVRAFDGRLLATSVPFYEIRVDMSSSGFTPQIISQNIDSLSLCLSKLFKDKLPYEYKSELLKARKTGNRYFLIKRKASYDELKQLKTFPIFRLGQYKGGLIVIQSYQRVMPHGALAERTIGYTSDGAGVGIEYSFDSYLRGVQGVRMLRRLPGNVWVPANDRNMVDPEDGNDIITTIDINIQDVAEQALRRQLVKNNAKHGTAILMEVATGKIRAITNLERDSKNEYHESYNFAIGESVEPGSTFKLPVLMAALEDGYIELGDTIDTGKGVIQFYDKKIKDSHEGGYGRISVKQIFELSSNVGVAKIIDNHYKGKETQFVDRLYAMRLNEPLGLEIKGEGKPLMKYPGDPLWSGISLPMMSFGYEVKLTPLHILTFYNAVANNGKMVKPQFIEQIEYRGRVIKKNEVEVMHPSICSNSTLRKAREMLEGVVEHGTAKNLKDSDYKIAGKTGTAQIFNKAYGYKTQNQVSYMASFCGYFPAENPKYSIMVMISAPSNSVYYGNLVAGPVFKEIADKVYATSSELQKDIRDMYDKKTNDVPSTKNGFFQDLQTVLSKSEVEMVELEPKTKWVSTEKKDSSIVFSNIKFNKGTVPNVKGMGLKDAIFILENQGLRVVVNGRGSVVNQSLAPGTMVRSRDVIVLEMSRM